MASPQALCRAGLRTILSAESDGFNSQLAAALLGGGLAPMSVDFAPGSNSFFQGYLDPQDVLEGKTQLRVAPIALCLYTTGSVSGKFTNHPIFSGLAEVHLDCYINLRGRDETAEGIEVDDTDSILDAIDEAVLRVVAVGDGNWLPGVVYNQDIKIDHTAIVPLEEGYYQYSQIVMSCEVSI